MFYVNISGIHYLNFAVVILIPIISICFMFSLYFTLQIKHDIKHKQKTTRETRGNLEQSFARELLGNAIYLKI